MATTTTSALRESTIATPEAPGPRKMRRRFATRRGVLTWAAVLAALAAAIALAVVTLTGGDDTAKDRPNVERSESSDQAVNPNGPGAPASEHSTNWATGEDRAVNPNGPGAPASEHSTNWATGEDRAVNPNGPGAPASEHSTDEAS